MIGGLSGLTVNIWIAIGSRLYGKPTVTLPPGPIHNCFNTSISNDSSVTMILNNYTTSSYPYQINNATNIDIFEELTTSAPVDE